MVTDRHQTTDADPVVTVTEQGVHVEWHAHGLNIELRVRPGHVWALIEDARGELPPHMGTEGAAEAVIRAHGVLEARDEA